MLSSLLARLMLVVSLALVPALGFQAYAESEARRARQQMVEDEAMRLMRMVSGEQARIMEGAEQVLDLVGISPAIQDGQAGLCQRLLAGLLKQAPRYIFAAFLGLDGHTACAPRPVDGRVDASSRVYFRLALQTGGFAIGNYAVGDVTGQPSLHMAKPVRNRDGTVVGVVTVALSLDWFGQQLGHIRLPPGAVVSIADRSGTYLARRPDGERYVGQPMRPEDRFLLEGDADRVVTMTSLEGRPIVTAYSPLDSDPKGWVVAVGLDRDLAFADVGKANRTGMLLIIAGAGMALAITYLAGTQLIRRPLDRLFSLADSWRTGDLAARTGLSGDGSDFGRLAAAFDGMAAALETRVRDEVAAREAAQARAAHAERMQALGQLAGGIAHDFNNVLQGVGGAAALIERRAGDEAGVRRLARLALEAVERGASVTRRLLAFGHRSDLRAEAVDVGGLLGGLHEILGHTLGAAIAVQVRVETGVPPLLADRGQLETALINLATNARDAMPEGGLLTLSGEHEVAPDCLADLSPGHYVRLSVADTGSGMDAVTLARAAEPFFTTKKPGACTGLGLPMAKGFAEQSGGALRVESSLGKGATVSLWLPVAPCSGMRQTALPGAAQAAVASGRPAAPVRVLLVDDEAVLREVLAEQFESAGFSVVAAASGDEAISLLAAGTAVDALVTDLCMPGVDGLAVIRAAQERHPGLPAVLLTGYAGDGVALAVGGAISGSFSLLRKPIIGAQLTDRVRALLAGRDNAKL